MFWPQTCNNLHLDFVKMILSWSRIYCFLFLYFCFVSKTKLFLENNEKTRLTFDKLSSMNLFCGEEGQFKTCQFTSLVIWVLNMSETLFGIDNLQVKTELFIQEQPSTVDDWNGVKLKTDCYFYEIVIILLINNLTNWLKIVNNAK